MLGGQDAEALAVSLLHADLLYVGLNCATGPQEMAEHVRVLSEGWPGLISVLPNAGLPSVVDGKMHYDLTPEQLADYQRRFVSEFGVRIVGWPKRSMSVTGCSSFALRSKVHDARVDSELMRIIIYDLDGAIPDLCWSCRHLK